MNSHLQERRNAMNENNGHYQLRFSNSFVQPQQHRSEILRDEEAQAALQQPAAWSWACYQWGGCFS